MVVIGEEVNEIVLVVLKVLSVLKLLEILDELTVVIVDTGIVVVDGVLSINLLV